MPRFEARAVPEGWQIVERANRFWVQRQRPDGLWQDMAGPFTRRFTAVQKIERMARWEQEDEQAAEETGAPARE